MLAKCKKSVEKECWGLSYKAFTGWRDCVTNNTPCLRCEGMECTNQGVNDSHSAGIRSPFNQDEGRACRERQRRMIPLSHAKWCRSRSRPAWFECAACAPVSIRREFATPSVSPSYFNARTIPGSGEVDDGLWRLWQRCCVCLASHTLPWQMRAFHWLILPGLLPWLLTAFLHHHHNSTHL